MCGISGVVGRVRPASSMIDVLSHRGPDGVRREVAPGRLLEHARLSIIDLEGGWQPLTAAGSTIVGNGEIYNYVELASEFGLRPELRTASDFEPLLHLYAREGPAAFTRLRGMYAFCLAGVDGRTWLVRDSFGIKPLYVLEQEGSVAFASEPRAFFKAGLIAPEIEIEAAQELVSLNYTLGERTIFKNIRRLAPGEIVEIRDGRLAPRGRRVALHRVRTSALENVLGRLDAVLEESVRLHLRADVRCGLFLSGGIDSAAVATLMARLHRGAVTALTCAFDAPGVHDERKKAERVARALNLDWREVRFDEADFWRILPQVAWALDDPTADYAALPTFKLGEAAKGTLSVVLTGDGGDELFGGYGRYRRALRPAWLGGRPAEPRGGDPAIRARWRAAASPPSGLTPLQRAQWGDVATWLPNDILLKLDRCLMAHGLEGRTPFLDPAVASFGYSLPDRHKVRDGYGKYLLRR